MRWHHSRATPCLDSARSISLVSRESRWSVIAVHSKVGIRCDYVRNLDTMSNQQAKGTKVIDPFPGLSIECNLENQDAESLHQLVSTDHDSGLKDVFRFIKDAAKTSRIVK